MEIDMQRITNVAITMLFLCVSLFTTAQEYRSIDGFNNNQSNPEIGASHSPLSYWTRLDYADGFNAPKMGATYNKVNPRYISNKIFSQDNFIPDIMNLSDYTWVFGQFIDHDITLIENSPFEFLDNIVVPDDDKFFPPGQVIPMLRNAAMEGTGTGPDNPRKHLNLITSFVDGSGIYGSDVERASWLRAENGKLKVSTGNLLPWNTIDGEFNSSIDFNAPFMADDTRSLKKFFVAGDIRANENPLLIAFHTLFVREHNRIAEDIASNNPSWSSEKIYQEAKKLNTAFLQNIVFNEWLPAMGVAIPVYQGYREDINPSISNVFSAAAFRLGHTLINGTILRMDNRGESIEQGHVALRDAYFNPYLITLTGGIDPYFKGMGTQTQQNLDCKVIDDVRNFLFGAPGQGGLDLAAININRARERGLAPFNDIREDIGLPRTTSFQALTDDTEDAEILESIYGNVDNIDPWVGMLAEKKLPNSLFGELMMHIVKKQFQYLRDGDRFYFENDITFTNDELAEIKSTKLHDILMRNTTLEVMQKDLFIAMPHDAIPNGPQIEKIDLNAVAYPNPTADFVNIKLYSSIEKNATLRIVDYAGRTISTSNLHLYEGDNILTFDMVDNKFPRGLYNFIINYGDNFSVVKVIKE
jgi:hypothetical protein